MKLRDKVILSFIVFVIGPFLIVGWLSLREASKTTRSEVGKTMAQLVRQNQFALDKTIAAVNDTTIAFIDNQFISDRNQRDFWLNIRTFQQLNTAESILKRVTSDGTVYSIYREKPPDLAQGMYSPMKNAGFVYYDANANDKRWIRRTLAERGAGVVQRIDAGTGAVNVTYSRSILDPADNALSLGVLEVSHLEILLNKDLLSVELPAGAEIYFLNQDRELLMSVGAGQDRIDWRSGLYEEAAERYRYVNDESGEWLIVAAGSAKNGSSLIYRIPLEAIVGKLLAYQKMLLGSSLIYIVLVLAYVLYLLRLIIKPLGKLVSFTRQYEPGSGRDGMQWPKRSDEVGLLYDAFQRMTVRLNQEIDEKYVIELGRREIELTTLQSQITPHLLYNTLDSIYWYSIKSGNHEVGAMVKDLSQLLRIGLSRGRQLIAIREELDHVQAYCRLQEIRYPDAFEVSWDIEEGVLDFTILKVILQPLVENAIFHGISHMDGEGQMWVRVRRSGDHIRLVVEDNGFAPVDMEMLSEILNGTRTDKGYGIRNVHKRIQLHYGSEYGIRYARRDGGGTVATVELPITI